jgi:hypothetical protein
LYWEQLPTGHHSHPVKRTIGVIKNTHGHALFHGHSSIFFVIVPPFTSVSAARRSNTSSSLEDLS